MSNYITTDSFGRPCGHAVLSEQEYRDLKFDWHYSDRLLVEEWCQIYYGTHPSGSNSFMEGRGAAVWDEVLRRKLPAASYAEYEYDYQKPNKEENHTMENAKHLAGPNQPLNPEALSMFLDALGKDCTEELYDAMKIVAWGYMRTDLVPAEQWHEANNKLLRHIAGTTINRICEVQNRENPRPDRLPQIQRSPEPIKERGSLLPSYQEELDWITRG